MLASGPVAQEKLGIWMISVIGATVKKIRDDGRQAAFSSDGSQIVFLDGNTREMSVMNADGSQAHTFLKPEAGYHYWKPIWLPQGRLLYLRAHLGGGHASIEVITRDSKGGDPVLLFSSPKLVNYTTAQDGRLILSLSESPPNQYSSNLWEVRFDPSTGKPKGVPRRLTDWTGFNFYEVHLTADNRQMVFLQDRSQSDVYVADLSKEKENNLPQRLTLNDRLDWPGSWLTDNKTVFLYSDRSGNFDLYKQSLGQHDAEAVVSGPDEKWAPMLSPDGKWILYMQWPKTDGDAPAAGKIMRVPLGGGASEPVMEIKGHPGIYGSNFVADTVGGYPSFACPRQPGANCVLAESDETHVSFSSFDPEHGGKKEITKLNEEPGNVAWAISPDGTQIATAIFDFKEANVRIIPVAGGEVQKLSAGPFTELSAVAWTADNKALLLASQTSKAATVVRMGLNGAPEKLFQWFSTYISSLTTSPDGHYLAIGAFNDDANAWLIPAFPSE